MVEMGNSGPGESGFLIQGHTASNWQAECQDHVYPIPKPVFFPALITVLLWVEKGLCQSKQVGKRKAHKVIHLFAC